MGAVEVEGFLTHLAVAKGVSASTSGTVGLMIRLL